MFRLLQACIQVCPKTPASFDVDNVRVAKLVGGGLHNSSVVRGMVMKTDAVGTIKHMEKAKVCNDACSLPLIEMFFFLIDRWVFF